MWFMKLVPAILLFENVISDMKIDPLVDSKVGLIKGLRATDGNYSMFLGIPYATVDKGNPFGASQPHPGFKETFEAVDDSARCPQRNGETLSGTLDCLHLNVFAPNSANPQNLLPVLVFIHGGFFQFGSFGRQDYGPKFLVRHDIILVTINYRLGPYGFMCLDTPEFPGNQGLKDQIKALKWVKDNIAAFGGDPDQVTLSGQSAGAAAVDFHLMYPGERLFSKVILQSASALTPARLIDSDKTKPLQLAKHFSLETSDLNEALTLLATVNTNSLLEATQHLNLAFRACVEKHFEGVESFIPQHPAKVNRSHVNNIPVLIGSVDKELMITYVNQNTDFFRNLNIFMDELDNIFDFADNLQEIHDNVRNFYVGDHVMTEEDKWEVIDFASEFTYVHPIQRAMKKFVESGAKNIYSYVFNYNGGRNLMKFRNNIQAPGAAHADELGYLFDPSDLTEVPSCKDQAVIDRMTTMWTNFVKFGNPTPSTSELLPVTWTPITANRWHCLRIGTELTLGGRPFHDRMAFWDLFYSVYAKFEKGVK